MKYKTVVFLMFVGILFAHKTETRSFKKDEIKDMSIPLNPYEATTFPYIHTVGEPRRSSHHHRYAQKSNPTTTTPRPFVNYWPNLANIVRNVRVPVPMITWNITNPLANLFNLEEQQQELELPQQNDYYHNTRNQLRQKTKRRRKHPNKRHRKHKRPIVQQTVEEEQQQHEGHHHHHHEQEFEEEHNQIILPQYPISDKISETNGPMYFYDPNTDAYYAVQKVRAMGSYIEGIPYNPRLITEKQQEIKDESAEVVENSASNENMENDDESNNENDINSAEATEINKNSEEATTNEDTPKAELANNDEETLRNVLGSFMRDDPYVRQRQRTKPKKTYNLKDKNLKSKPRQQLNYYFLLDVN